MAARLVQRLENGWWAEEEVTAHVDELSKLGLKPDDMRFYGEIGFVECGAKPLAILSGLPTSCITSYIHKALEPTRLFTIHSPDSLPSASNDSQLHAGILASDLRTTNYELGGSIYVCNPAHALFPKVREVLSKKGKVTELEIAEVLDYPWALPEEGIGEDDEYVEVGYVEKESKTLLTSYGVSRREFDSTKEKIKSHFARYATLTRGTFDFTIVCK
eukprot:Phypoly_transcript_18336.p1 GENE.Phypoly_transcript_18336~~Phypoly_transcript_18336.p1  ORF type:complete len:251 (+),score=40.00 Phypoly_transcript_18336:103-753(+)